MNTNEIINLIANSKKTTKTIAFVQGNFEKIEVEKIEFFGTEKFGILFGDYKEIISFIEKNKNNISKYRLEINTRNSAIPLSDLTKFNARIEHGAIIRDMVKIGEGAIIMMGAIINIGAEIGEKTMIDMNAVIGGRAIIGKNCHIGAGTVIAGVIEPPSAKPVIIEDNVIVGANAVILEGVHVGKNSVIAAGAVVIEDVPENSVVAGVPGKVIKQVDKKTKQKTQIVDALRKLR
ncbi:MAG: 2,3,4,5-tetrahydropyridine-2,6-dicarboxylate N-acetyltransferase [Thermosipho sp. (in: Bacteria)]|nr:2,3,4,5-tetrahydropyridine-2,6-dicarboxylate N-acetyltransferase [Thermosipho sp. (in: thermotogales)]